MLNQERIRLMTRLAVYEQGEGKEYIPMCQYYRSDYLGLQMLKAFICSTIAFAILLFLQVLYDLEEWQSRLYELDFGSYIFKVVMIYVIFVLFYQVVAWLVYSMRYKRAMKKHKIYHNRLKKVVKLHEREEKLLPLEE